MGRRSPDVRAFLFDPSHASDRNRILDRLRGARPTTGVASGETLVELCSVVGMGEALATRLLALARPDWFVVVNNMSRKLLTETTGIGLTGKRWSYQQLITWLADQRWHASPNPTDPWEFFSVAHAGCVAGRICLPLRELRGGDPRMTPVRRLTPPDLRFYLISFSGGAAFAPRARNSIIAFKVFGAKVWPK